jgi:NitT/TauT family transport system substrate-binding protein
MSNKNLVLGLSLVFAICLLVSCSGARTNTISSPLKIEWTLWQGDYTLLIANQMGFFMKHGVNVTPVYYETSTKALPDLAGAKLEGGLFTMSDTLLATGIADLRAVLVSDNGGAYTVVASSDIKTVNDLREKRIGLNIHTSSELFVSDMLKTELMTGNDVSYIELSPSQIVQNIPGQIDAGVVWEPYTTQALRQGLVAVYRNSDYSARLPKLLVFRKSIVEQRPDDIRSFILAWDEAVQYRKDHPQESLAIIAKATGLPAIDLALPKDFTLFTISENVNLFSNIAGTDPSSIYYITEHNKDFLLSSGYITNPPSTTSLLDPSYLK